MYQRRSRSHDEFTTAEVLAAADYALSKVGVYQGANPSANWQSAFDCIMDGRLDVIKEARRRSSK